MSTVGSWNQKLLTSGTTLLLMVSFLSANQKYFYPVLYDMYIILCLRILAVYEVSTFFFNKEMLINQKCPHMKCKICKFLVLSNLALKVLLLLSGFIFSFFVGVRFCLTAMLYLIMGFFLPSHPLNVIVNQVPSLPVFILVLLEADPETRIYMYIIYWGDDPRRGVGK